ncbi:MAG: hypothetical protein WCX16_06265, partial [Candidatus Omnitrophota bacterium]
MPMTEEQQDYNQEKFRVIFENSPIAIWEEDLSCFHELLDQLKADHVKNMRTYLLQHPRLALRAFRKIKITDVNRAALDL